MNKTYNIIWNAARGMYIVTSELARSGSRAIVSVSASCAVTLLAMDAAPAVAEETRVSIPSQTTTYTLSGATPFVVETGNTVATDIATSAAIVGDNSNDWDLLIESGAVVGSSLTDSQAMNLDSLTGATSVHNQGTITGSNEDGTILLQNGGSVINDGRIENSATYEHDPQDIPQEYAGVYMLNGGSYVSSESGVLEGVSGVIVQSGEAHITNGGMINSDGSWRSYGVEFRDGTYGTIVNTGTIITTASDGSGKIEDAAIYVHTLNDMAVSGSVSVDNSGLMQSDFITVALYHGSHFEVVNRVGGVITAGNSSLVGIKSTAMELKVGVDNLVTNDGTISAYGTANTYGIHYGESTSGGVITNTGSITTTGGGAGDASVYVHGNGDGTVVNNSGTMSSTVYGVYLDSARSKGHTLNNQAGSAISANTAVAINGNGNTITNQGKMTGVSDGLLISGNNNIVTTSGGEISGKNGIRVSKGSGNQITAKSGSKITATSTGISIASGNNQVTTESGSAIVAKDNGILINSGANNVTNGGSITATGSSNSYGIQYNSGASGTITNTGTITTTGKGVGDASVYAHGGAVTINNSGTMDSSVFGVYVTTGHTLNNLAGGSISANTAVQFHGNNNKLANAGAISGDTNGVTISGSGNTLTNQGKITGGTNAILINSGSKNNTLTLNTGTEISGSITDDNNSASANNNLILDGEGTLGSSISGLNSVTSSGDWTLSGATMNLSGTTNSALWVKSGTLILNGAMTAKGATVDSGTTLQIGNGGTLGAFNGDIVDNGTLTFNRSDAAAYGSVISGSGNVVKQGGGELTLSNNNSYSGGTTIAEGTLTATAGGALGSGNIDNRAYLKLDAASASDPFIVADLTTHSGATVEIGAGSTLQANTLTQQDGSTLTADLTATSGPAIRAKNVNLDGTLNVASPASQEPIRSTDDLISLALIESDNAISGSGQVVKSGDETLTLSGTNSYTGGTTISGGTLVATNVEALGSGDVTDDATLELNTGGTFDNAISGSGQVVKSGDKMLTLSGANSYSGGTLISDGTLVASNVEALGTGDVTNNATLALNTGGDFTNNISGSGQVVKSGDDTLTLSGANSYTGGTTISGGTLVATNVDALGTGDVTNSSTLELNTGGTFDNAISGSGQVVKSGDETLTLSGSNTYTGGTLISGGTLVATNVDALGTGDVTDNATLELNTGGTFDNVISGSGQVVKSGDDTLTLSGANSYTGGTLISGGTLVATSVEALGSGDVTDNAVLELNTGGTFDNAISGSGQVVKSGDKTLTLSGANSYTGGTTISGGTLVASNVEALGSGDIDNYASLQLNASGQFVTANLTTHDNAITAIGAGSALRANTLTQEANSTLAVHLTDSNSGAIVTADRANLGGTLDITGIGNVAKSWTRDAYAYTLIDSDSAIDSDFAQFTVAGMDAKQVDFLTVDGRVNADDDTRYDVTASLSWYADSDNAATDAHGTFTLSEQGHSFTLNTALTDVDATLNPDSATYWDGKSLIKRGAGTLILGAQNTYSGDTDVQEGALWLAETATIGSAGSAQAVNIAANAAFGGHNATVNGHVNNLGNLYFVDTFTVNGDVVNSSAMISGSDQPNNTLTIAGNYTGNDGHLYLNTQLGDDSSPTDKLIVTGDTAGSTTLHITNVNGLGAQTVNGIEVIEVGGQSDGDFRLYKGHVDINAWTYTLKQDGGDWYLRSESDDVPDDGGEVTPPDDGGEVTPPDDGGEVTPPDDGGEVTPPDDGGEVTPPDDDGEVTPPDDGGDITPPDDGGDITPPDGGDVTPVAPQYRADIGVYLGNQWMARNLQMQTLYDREGSQYRSADGSIWMRFKAGKAESQAVNGNVDIDSDYSQFQLGGDILTWSDGAQSVTVGLMGSYINASTDSTGNRGADGSQFSANGSVDGYNLGLYATWFADAQSHRGAYIDSWYQYGAYNNSVDNDGLSASRYDSAAHAVSLETGYRYDIALSNRNTVSLTPQAQVTWQRYSADTVIDDGGTRISGQNDDSWTTRLGMRVDGKLYKESGRIQPFMEVNWLHASDNASATFGDTKVSQDLPNDRVEVKVGIQANVSERLSVYAQAAGQKGKNDYGDASFSLNMRYNW
ncbi:autotransporter outer membrane beta-barrel domain-containing protein [Salmonella enterica]|uniref:autotransporter outer membrane beta-barrel domain-containing protein n=1 Tax=Salmonella enterica TaxID=28901 RepID=UPI001CD672AE|nr:autotransporter outer membrane beta-barrel domain-containing protein [Salmonella enterica]MCA1084177.1 autotransporter outer membrane beta-barrel domain-containing protein [Salmonella enterica]MCA1113537.1 autotransporter outer membrane beta-barrel domain-containing protein [Salmonella enterica]MCA1117260.1 autotransporter outer membrane beta-barrel domain-containing protein [Salmonella enterica]